VSLLLGIYSGYRDGRVPIGIPSQTPAKDMMTAQNKARLCE
jgi:hypothetical protein